MHDHQLVLGDVGGGCRQVGDGLALDALEVHVSAFAFLFFPGHADEGPLDVVIYDLGTPAGSFLYFFFVGGIS